MRGVAEQVATSIDDLRATLIRTVRTATKEVNRRRHDRYGVNLPCVIRAGNQEIPAKMEDCSQEGLCVLGAAADIVVGTRIAIALANISQPLSADVLTVEHGKLHCHLILEGPAKAQWIARLQQFSGGGTRSLKTSAS